MVSLAIKKAVLDERSEAKVIRDQMLSSVVANYNPCDIQIADGGKPFLPNSNTGFSISHSKGVILCGVNCGKKVLEQHDCINLYFESCNDFEIGADIEMLGTRELSHLERICDKLFSDAEKQDVESSSDKEFKILEFWTKKEAYLKLVGVGIKDLASADTKLLQNDYLFISEKVSLGSEEFVLSVCVKR